MAPQQNQLGYLYVDIQKKKAKETKKGGDGVMLGNQVLPSSQNLDGAKQ